MNSKLKKNKNLTVIFLDGHYYLIPTLVIFVDFAKKITFFFKLQKVLLYRSSLYRDPHFFGFFTVFRVKCATFDTFLQGLKLSLYRAVPIQGHSLYRNPPFPIQGAPIQERPIQEPPIQGVFYIGEIRPCRLLEFAKKPICETRLMVGALPPELTFWHQW